MFRHCRTFSHCVLKSQTNYVLSKPVRILLHWSPFTCTASPRTHSTNIKMRSYLQYMKRKVKGAPAPPYNHVCQVGDPVLQSRAVAVEPRAIQGPEVQKVIKTLVKVMRRLECVGLSASQIGVPPQILAALGVAKENAGGQLSCFYWSSGSGGSAPYDFCKPTVTCTRWMHCHLPRGLWEHLWQFSICSTICL